MSSSVAQIRSAGEGIIQIVSGIRSVASSMSQVSTASANQRPDILEISNVLAQLDELTQQNAQIVVRTIAQSSNLEVKAGALAGATGHFKLQQGVPEEAILLVERAVEFRRKALSQQSYCQGITDNANHFYDRDMYVFVINEGSTYLSFGGNPAKVGTRVQDIPGIDGQGMLDKIVQQASIEPG